MEGDEVVAAEEEIELGGGKFIGAGEIHGMRDHEEVVFVVLDFREGTRRDAVLDGERVKIKNAFEDEFDFFVGGLIEIHPEDEALVAVDEAQRLELEVAADEFALAEDERMNHGWGKIKPES